MFEASFRMVAKVESDSQGQRVYRVTKREDPPNDTEFSSRVATLYQQEVYRTLQVGDSLTITVRLDIFPAREVERTVRFREDRQFEGNGLPQPTPDLLPFLRLFYEPLMQQVYPGDVFTITFRVERL